jgi:hypothetical protein
MRLTGEYAPSRFFGVYASCTLDRLETLRRKLRIYSRIDSRFLPALSVAPFCSVTLSDHSSENRTLCGFSVRMDLFHRTCGEAEITFPIGSPYQESCALYAKANFFF